MDRHPIGDFHDTTMEKIKEIVDVNTVIGTAITTTDGITILPVSKVSVGMGTGGGDFTKETSKGDNFGVGNVSGVTITPTAFLVVKDGNVRMLNVSTPASSTVDRLVETLPELIDKISSLLGKDKDKDTEF